MARQRPRTVSSPEWQFATFPVFFGFMGGAFFVAFLTWLTQGIAFNILFILSMFGFSFCVAHIATHALRRRATGRARQRAEEDERERRALAARAAATREGDGVTAPARTRRRRRR